MSNTPEVEQQLDQIRKHFASTLPGRSQKILEQWLALRARWNTEGLANLYADIHRLCGCCGTLGVKNVGDTARSIQSLLTEIMERNSGPCEETQSRLDGLIAFLNGLCLDPAKAACRILVVEDDMELASVYSAILREAGMTVLVTDPDQAGECARDFHPDLVLLDLTTPNCRRFELAGTIQKTPILSAIPLICLTCEEEPGQVSRQALAGNIVWLQKPCDPEVLIALIRARLNPRMASRPLPGDGSTSISPAGT